MHALQAAGGAALTSPEQPSDADAAASRTRAPRRLIVLVAVLALTLLAIDQATKFWAERALADGNRIEVIGEFFQLRLVYNPGAAFSFATGATGLLTILAIGVVAFMIWTARRLGSRGWAIALGVLLGGALGNLTDRLFRPPGVGQGHVVDMFALSRLPIIDTFPVFNVADICITTAAILIIWFALRGIDLDGTRVGDKQDEEASDVTTTAPTDEPGDVPTTEPKEGRP